MPRERCPARVVRGAKAAPNGAAERGAAEGAPPKVKRRGQVPLAFRARCAQNKGRCGESSAPAFVIILKFPFAT